MIDNLINEIEQAMLNVLDNEQLSQLRKVLDYTFRNISVTKKMMGCSTGTSNSKKRISPSSLMNLNIPLPLLDDQQKFVAIAEQADKSENYVKYII